MLLCVTLGAATVDGVVDLGSVDPDRTFASEPYDAEWVIPDPDMLLRRFAALAWAAAYLATCGKVLAGS